jgi:hypothetical protein
MLLNLLGASAIEKATPTIAMNRKSLLKITSFSIINHIYNDKNLDSKRTGCFLCEELGSLARKIISATVLPR